MQNPETLCCALCTSGVLEYVAHGCAHFSQVWIQVPTLFFAFVEDWFSCLLNVGDDIVS